MYGDEQEAKKKFDRYKRCTKDYCIRMQKGTVLEQLVVAIKKEESGLLSSFLHLMEYDFYFVSHIFLIA